MKMVDHPNIVKLKHCFYSHTVGGGSHFFIWRAGADFTEILGR